MSASTGSATANRSTGASNKQQSQQRPAPNNNAQSNFRSGSSKKPPSASSKPPATNTKQSTASAKPPATAPKQSDVNAKQPSTADPKQSTAGTKPPATSPKQSNVNAKQPPTADPKQSTASSAPVGDRNTTQTATNSNDKFEGGSKGSSSLNGKNLAGTDTTKTAAPDTTPATDVATDTKPSIEQRASNSLDRTTELFAKNAREAKDSNNHDYMSQALTGKPFDQLSADEQKGVLSLQDELIAGNIKPTITIAQPGSAEDIASGNKALGDNIINEDYQAAYVPGDDPKNGTIMINEDLVSKRNDLSLDRVMAEELGEAASTVYKSTLEKLGVTDSVAEGDVGARVGLNQLLQAQGNQPVTPETAPELYVKDSSDVTQIRAGGEVLDAVGREAQYNVSITGGAIDVGARVTIKQGDNRRVISDGSYAQDNDREGGRLNVNVPLDGESNQRISINVDNPDFPDFRTETNPRNNTTRVVSDGSQPDTWTAEQLNISKVSIDHQSRTLNYEVNLTKQGTDRIEKITGGDYTSSLSDGNSAQNQAARRGFQTGKATEAQKDATGEAITNAQQTAAINFTQTMLDLNATMTEVSTKSYQAVTSGLSSGSSSELANGIGNILTDMNVLGERAGAFSNAAKALVDSEISSERANQIINETLETEGQTLESVQASFSRAAAQFATNAARYINQGVDRINNLKSAESQQRIVAALGFLAAGMAFGTGVGSAAASVAAKASALATVLPLSAGKQALQELGDSAGELFNRAFRSTESTDFFLAAGEAYEAGELDIQQQIEEPYSLSGESGLRSRGYAEVFAGHPQFERAKNELSRALARAWQENEWGEEIHRITVTGRTDHKEVALQRAHKWVDDNNIEENHLVSLDYNDNTRAGGPDAGRRTQRFVNQSSGEVIIRATPISPAFGPYELPP